MAAKITRGLEIVTYEERWMYLGLFSLKTYKYDGVKLLSIVK